MLYRDGSSSGIVFLIFKAKMPIFSKKMTILIKKVAHSGRPKRPQDRSDQILGRF